MVVEGPTDAKEPPAMTEELFHDPEALRHLTAYGRDGGRIGSVDLVYVDDLSGRPEWVTVRTDPPGEAAEGTAGEVFAPLDGADPVRHGELRLAWTAEAVRTAPRLSAEQHLGLDQEQELYLHYGLVTPVEEASGAPGVGDDRPKAPVTGDEKELQDVKELADEPEAPAPRLRKFVPADSDEAPAGSTVVRGENH
jgi:hypothetical protein